ncbi:MAG: hypothetical protein AAFR87_08850 [Bacteroidota bacterium]
MKLKTLIIATLTALFTALTIQTQAQVRDSLILFKAEPSFLMGDRVQLPQSQLNQPFLFSGASGAGKSIFVHISAVTIKNMALPAKTRVSKGPVTLKRNGVCYTFACDKSNCSDCKLYWNDRNGDGKVQPRRELRCFCSSKKLCKIRVRRSKC